MHTAVCEWNYARQMLEIRLAEATGHVDRSQLLAEIFRLDFLIARPLLQAVLQSRNGQVPVLLIDELDRSDEEFEAFLLELLSDFQISILELGTICAEVPPVVVITSNRTREIHDGLKRRCLYYWVAYPSFEKELAIVRRRMPGLAERLARQVVAFVQALRHEDLYKPPGVAETLDWAEALLALDRGELDPGTVAETVGTLLKYRDDI